MNKTPAPRKCSMCPKEFIPARMGQHVCGPLCGRRKVKADKKAEKERDKARRQALETIPELLAKAQKEHNAWVRARDKDQPCISCGAPPPDLSKLHAGRDAGHYRSVGAAGHLRFHEDNCHAQCVHCNQYRSGNAVDYRLGLIERIGLARVEALESNNTPHKWQKDELREIASEYREKKRELLKEREEA